MSVELVKTHHPGIELPMADFQTVFVLGIQGVKTCFVAAFD